MFTLLILVLILNTILIFSYKNQRMHKQLLKSYKYININKSYRLKSFYSSSLSSLSSLSSSLSSSSSSFDIKATKDNNNVRVITYNVLSSSLAEPDYFFT